MKTAFIFGNFVGLMPKRKNVFLIFYVFVEIFGSIPSRKSPESRRNTGLKTCFVRQETAFLIRGETMKNAKNIMPPFLREVCSAICAIVHANINENQFFKQSGFNKRTRISSKLKRNIFSDHGVIVEVDQDMIKVRVYISTRVGTAALIGKAIELQQKITEDILLLTSFKIRQVDIVITGIHQM